MDSGFFPHRLGARRRLLRTHRRPAGPQSCPDAHDPYLRNVHRAFIFRADLVAVADFSVSGRVGNRRRMGSGRFAAFGDLATPLASLDGRRAPDRREPWDNAGRVGELPVGWLPLPPRVPGWRAAGVAGALDSPLSPRTRGMAAGEA